MKVIKISRKPTVRDYAIAAARSSEVISNRNANHIAPVIAGVASLAPKAVQGIKKVVDAVKSLKKGKYEGYNLPFKLLAGIEALRSRGYTLTQILTNETLWKIADHLETKTADYQTSTVQNAARKDIDLMLSNPAKYYGQPPSPEGPTYNYRVLTNDENLQLYNELIAISDSLGEQISLTQKENSEVAKEIAPLIKTIDNAILDTGKIPPETVQEKLQVFNDAIVSPATGTPPSSSAGTSALADAAIAFIGSLMEKKKSGEQLPGVYDKIATAGIEVENKIEGKVRSTVEGNIGEFVTKNAVLIGFAVLLLILAVIKRK
jgi:hypothetical protein